MAALAPSTINTKSISGNPVVVQASAAIGTFKGVFEQSSGSKFETVDVSNSAKLEAKGITVTSSGADGDRLVYVANGSILDVGAILTEGAAYFFDSSGDVVPYADLTSSTDYMVKAGFAKSNQLFVVEIFNTGEQKA